MLKKTITYKNFDDETVTDDFYFNLTKAELVELELSEKEGLSQALQTLVDSKNGAQIIDYFKKIILMSYGEKSADGKRFLKSEEIANSFSHTEAYSVLFMELATNADIAAAFINGIMPTDLMLEVSKLPTQVPEVHSTPITSEVPVGPRNSESTDSTQKSIEEMTREELKALIKAQK